ncbi:MAG: hypothetical protein V1753_02640 [Pseudomonadota bacterium]
MSLRFSNQEVVSSGRARDMAYCRYVAGAGVAATPRLIREAISTCTNPDEAPLPAYTGFIFHGRRPDTPKGRMSQGITSIGYINSACKYSGE